MPYPLRLKERLQAGEVILGTVLPGINLEVAGMIFAAKPDFLWIDQEHTPYDTESIAGIAVLGRQAGVPTVLRVPWNDPALIKRSYDVGAVGVMVPQIDTKAEAELAVRYAKYPPLGNRGISPWWPMVAGEDFMNVVRTANDETVLILQMESSTSYKNVEQILEVPNFDVLFVGPLDLSASLGVMGNTKGPEVQKIMRELPRIVEGSGKVLGTTFDDPADCKAFVDIGYRFMNVSDPITMGLAAFQNHVRMIRA